ncbi:MAG: ectonucleotide pyrophosphatase/phosphodiesterase [Gemmatimonadaceae bacterium]
MRRRGLLAAGLLLAAVVAACQVPEVAAGSQPPRVLLISLDGFRWDYVERPAAVRIRELAARGVRAERMVPVFPSKTFPNHYSIVTGLFAEEHGIVANRMRDPELGVFTLRDTLAQSESRWWGGEPIWVTVERQGRRAASASWPGSEAVIGGLAPTWWSRYWHDEPHISRIGRVLGWLALPVDSAPAVITAYFHDVDSEGHAHGPDAAETDSAIARVDRAVGSIVDGIARLGLTNIVNVILVADHGMVATSPSRLIILDELADLRDAEVVDWNPVAAIAPRADDVERLYRALHGAHPHLQVYRKGEVPARWRFNAHPRITPIVAVADEGWTITSRAQADRWRAERWAGGGTHGYNPELISMGALFVAAGPGIAQGRVVPPFRNVHVYPLMAHLLGLVPAPSSGSLDSVRAMLR